METLVVKRSLYITLEQLRRIAAKEKVSTDVIARRNEEECGRRRDIKGEYFWWRVARYARLLDRKVDGVIVLEDGDAWPECYQLP